MTSSARKKLLIGAGAGLAVLVAALLAAPSFIDLNSYKPQHAKTGEQRPDLKLLERVLDGLQAL